MENFPFTTPQNLLTVPIIAHQIYTFLNPKVNERPSTSPLIAAGGSLLPQIAHQQAPLSCLRPSATPFLSGLWRYPPPFICRVGSLQAADIISCTNLPHTWFGHLFSLTSYRYSPQHLPAWRLVVVLLWQERRPRESRCLVFRDSKIRAYKESRAFSIRFPAKTPDSCEPPICPAWFLVAKVVFRCENWAIREERHNLNICS